MVVGRKRRFEVALGFLVLIISCFGVESNCSGECNALASYYISSESNLTFMSQILSSSISEILSYNRQVTNPDYIVTGTRVNVPFSCGCVHGEFMAHQFVYNVSSGYSYQLVAQIDYANLTTIEMLQRFNIYEGSNIPDSIERLNVTVNCSCGNSHVSKDYGLFITYPLQPGENLFTISNQSGVPQQLLEDYNPNSNFSSGSVFIPGRDQTGTFPRLKSSSSGISGGATAGLSVAGVAGALFLAACFYVVFYRRKKVVEGSVLPTSFDDNAVKHRHGNPHGFNSDTMFVGICNFPSKDDTRILHCDILKEAPVIDRGYY